MSTNRQTDRLTNERGKSKWTDSKRATEEMEGRLLLLLVGIATRIGCFDQRAGGIGSGHRHADGSAKASSTEMLANGGPTKPEVLGRLMKQRGARRKGLRYHILLHPPLPLLTEKLSRLLTTTFVIKFLALPPPLLLLNHIHCVL